jgi:hypothetical protein
LYLLSDVLYLLSLFPYDAVTKTEEKRREEKMIYLTTGLEMKQGRLLVRCFHGCLEDGAEGGPAKVLSSTSHCRQSN